MQAPAAPLPPPIGTIPRSRVVVARSWLRSVGGCDRVRSPPERTWWFSCFTQTSVPTSSSSAGQWKSGVGRECGAMRSRAWRTSSNVGALHRGKLPAAQPRRPVPGGRRGGEARTARPGPCRPPSARARRPPRRRGTSAARRRSSGSPSSDTRAGRIRVRSSKPRITWSHLGRNRIGAGVSAAGRGARLRSYRVRPSSDSKRTRLDSSRSKPAWTSLTRSAEKRSRSSRLAGP